MRPEEEKKEKRSQKKETKVKGNRGKRKQR
jgi:hypothetical protein